MFNAQSTLYISKCKQSEHSSPLISVPHWGKRWAAALCPALKCHTWFLKNTLGCSTELLMHFFSCAVSCFRLITNHAPSYPCESGNLYVVQADVCIPDVCVLDVHTVHKGQATHRASSAAELRQRDRHIIPLLICFFGVLIAEDNFSTTVCSVLILRTRCNRQPILHSLRFEWSGHICTPKATAFEC